jgi:hypothetical protein
MGQDRNITYKDKIITSAGRAYKFQDLPTNLETIIEFWRIVRLYEADPLGEMSSFQDFINDLFEFIDDTKMCGWRDCIDYLCEDEDMGWFDE